MVFATESDPSCAPNPYIHTVDDRTVVKEGEFSFAVRIRNRVVYLEQTYFRTNESAKVAVGFIRGVRGIGLLGHGRQRICPQAFLLMSIQLVAISEYILSRDNDERNLNLYS